MLIALLMVLAVWMIVASPFIAMVTDRQRDIATLSDRLATLRVAISRIPALEQRDASLDARLDAGGRVWPDASDAATAALMQDRLGQAIRREGGLVRTASTIQGKDEGGLHSVRVRFSIEGTLDTVERTLLAVQTAKPAMFVDSMTIVAPASMPRDRAPRLSLDIEVVGYVRSTKE
jgi:Type II secretion system (T2SS), protein M subtype b